MSMGKQPGKPAPIADYELAGDLKIGQVGIANLRVRTLDVARLGAEMRDRVARAPNLFDRAAVIVDFGALPGTPDVASARALLDALREAGALPVALAYGSSDNERLAIELGLPLLAKFRAQYEPAGAEAAASGPASVAATASPPTADIAPKAAKTQAAAPVAASGEASSIHTSPVRSGQQIYAENRDLTLLATVGAGAEVIADGSIHVYGALRGRALAGARGDEKARIFCREFHAELVAIAGHYKVMDEIPAELRGKAVHIWLDNAQLNIAALA
jgi:septum site-determining protein MinC